MYVNILMTREMKVHCWAIGVNQKATKVALLKFGKREIYFMWVNISAEIIPGSVVPRDSHSCRTWAGDLSNISLCPDVLCGRLPSLDRGRARCEAPRRRSLRRPTRALVFAKCNLRGVSGPVGQSTPSHGGSRAGIFTPLASSPSLPPQ